MRRSIAAATLVAFLLLHPGAAGAGPDGRVVLVTLDGTRLADWRSPSLPALRTLLGGGASGLLSTRTATNPTVTREMREAAHRTLGAGRIGARTDARALASVLERAGVATTVIANLPGSPSWALAPERAAAMPQRRDATFPTGARTDFAAARSVVEQALATSRVILVDAGDTARVEEAFGADARRRGPWMRLATSRADAFLIWLRTRLSPRDTLIVASLTAPLERQRERRFLSAVAIAGAGVGRGVLTSDTTRRDGVMTIADLTATILDRAGVRASPEVTGRPARVVPSDDPLGRIAALEEDLIHASIVRGPLLRGAVVAAGALALLALLVVAAGRGKGGRARGLPSTGRGLLQVGLVAVAALPGVLFLEPLFGAGSVAAAASAVAGGVLAIALLARAAFGARAAATVIFGLTAILVLGDLTAGGGLAERSPLSYLIAEGARFHGIGNEAMGVVIGTCLLAGAAWLDRGLARHRDGVLLALLGLAVVMMAAPPLGAKFGSVPAAVPAFALFGLLATGRRPTPRSVIAIVLVTILAADLAVVADSLRGAGGGTHISGALGGGSGEILGRKAGAAGRLLALSFWMGGLLACGGSMVVLAWRRGSLLGRGLWGLPATRAAMWSCALAAAGAVAANDAGVTTAAWLAMLASSSLFSNLLVPNDR